MMNATLNSSSEFASLVHQLHKAPEDPALKQAVMMRLPKMKALAQGNPLDLFRLAQIYPKNSTQYQQFMKQSADLGCTNAMLALCELHLNNATASDLRKAACYFVAIEESGDTYILKHCNALLEQSETLAAEVKLLKKSMANDARFFSSYNPCIPQFKEPGCKQPGYA